MSANWKLFWKSAIRSGLFWGTLGLFGPFCLWRLLLTEFPAAQSWPEPPLLSLRLGLLAAIGGGMVGGILTVLNHESTEAALHKALGERQE